MVNITSYLAESWEFHYLGSKGCGPLGRGHDVSETVVATLRTPPIQTPAENTEERERREDLDV